MSALLRWRPTAWEGALFVLIIAAGIWSARLSPYYLNLDQIAFSTRHFIIPGLLALGLLIVVVVGEIDISLASTLAVGAVLLAKCSAFGIPIYAAAPAAVMAGAALGTFNGVLVSRFALPSLAVTLGTMGAFRGLAFIIGSEIGYTDFDDPYLYIGNEQIGVVPVSFVIFIVVALCLAFLMHATVFGRRCFAIGNNQDAARIAGVNVVGVKTMTYALAGGLAGLAAVVWVGQYGSARGDNADGMILFVVTAVVLGGVEIRGGSGTVLGVVLALLLLGTLRNGMGLANVAGPSQTVVFGLLLVFGVLRPIAVAALRRWRRPNRSQPDERESASEEYSVNTAAK
jgi:rhamnose transport system permease protein